MDSSDFKSNESFFKKDLPDEKSEIGFVERNTKSVLRSKIHFWIYRKEHTLNILWMAMGVMSRCSIRERLTEKLHNCYASFTTHCYPPFLKFRPWQRIFVQFPTAMWSIYKYWHETFSDERHGPPPPHPGRASSLG